MTVTRPLRFRFTNRIAMAAVLATTLALPAAVTAATGMDALTHNIESYLSPAYHPLCDGIALEGLRIGARALANAVNEPGNLQAHEQLSEREFQVFLKLAKGETAGDIATTLSLSVKTVSTYRSRVMEKMQLASNSDLTYYALKNGLIQ